MWREISPPPAPLATASYHRPPELPPLKPYNTSDERAAGSARRRRRSEAAGGGGGGGGRRRAGDLWGGAEGGGNRRKRPASGGCAAATAEAFRSSLPPGSENGEGGPVSIRANKNNCLTEP